MRITRDMMAPELRRPGTLMRTVWPYYTYRRFKLCNTMLDGVISGLRLTPTMRYRQITLPRPGGGGELRLCIYTPKHLQQNVPGVLWMHGGGFALGLPEQDFMFIKRFVRASGCVVVSPDYRRSVNAPYPAAMEDCYQALLWLRDNGHMFGMRPDQIFVGGDSAGGGLTAALCMLARDRGEVSVAFQMPLYPMLDDRMTTPSSQGNDAPVWNSRSNRVAWDTYLNGLSGDAVPKYASPARETDYRGLPPALTFVGSVEMFRDETRQFVQALREADVPVRYKEFEGCFHGFDMLCFWTRISKEAHIFMVEGFMHAVRHYFKPQPDGAAGDMQSLHAFLSAT